MTKLITLHARQLTEPDAYLTDEWYAARQNGIAASEIAAVLGLSPWVSPFDLWWEKRTGQDSQPENKAMGRGHRYEALVLEDFAAEHPEFRLEPCGLVANIDRPWQMCTPDALACEGEHGQVYDHNAEGWLLDPVAVVQAKTAANRDEWGEPYTDEIPMHYRCQVLWEMDCLGVNVAYVPAVFGFEYREYVVEYHEADVMLMREAAEAFLADVREDRQPEPDAHKATTRRLKRLHPDLVDDEAEIPATIIRQYQLAARIEKAAKERKRLAENRVRHLLGANARGTVNGRKVVSHSIYDMKERVMPATTVDRLNFTRKDIQP